MIPLIAKMSIQEKVAELERRIVALEDAAKKRPVVTTTTTTSTITPEQDAHLSKMWGHFNAAFDEFGKIFK